MWINQAMCIRTAPRGYGEIHQWIKTKRGFSMKDACWISCLFFFVCFPSMMQRNTQVSSSIRHDNANGRVGMNSALTISVNCCFALFRSRRCCCCCCLAAKGGLHKEVRGRGCWGSCSPGQGFPRARVLEGAGGVSGWLQQRQFQLARLRL